ncbi:MAG TPA: efflux RND transporter periplasmic adaptor subunit, partial [Verrucomicrobiae bacterium]|nr:efflux RND transporter periplasmic adaptor subunit [Verrucomicrobiae bacterium]
MKGKKAILILVLVLAVAASAYYILANRAHAITLTGIVTTDEVIVSSEIQGRLQELLVKQGDAVTNGELLGLIQPQEWQADLAYYANTEKQAKTQVTQAEADLKYQESQTSNQVRQAEANLAATKAQATQAEADLENARLNFQRLQDLYEKRVESVQAYDQARTSFEAFRARADSLHRQVLAAEAALGLAKSTMHQIAAKQAVLEGSVDLSAAAGAQEDKARVRLGYTEIRAPINGIVNVRAALKGEVVNLAQGIVTLINPDDLWVRIDVEESYIDRIHLGDKLTVRLPSGAEREGTVFFRGVDADYATQRDVSRTKRDIK